VYQTEQTVSDPLELSVSILQNHVLLPDEQLEIPPRKFELLSIPLEGQSQNLGQQFRFERDLEKLFSQNNHSV
jgi:hypothetical protein